jgi:hypothetical protein
LSQGLYQLLINVEVLLGNLFACLVSGIVMSKHKFRSLLFPLIFPSHFLVQSPFQNQLPITVIYTENGQPRRLRIKEVINAVTIRRGHLAQQYNNFGPLFAAGWAGAFEAIPERATAKNFFKGPRRSIAMWGVSTIQKFHLPGSNPRIQFYQY